MPATLCPHLLKVIKHDQFPILILTNNKRSLNVFIFSNDCMEWEMKFSPSVRIEPTTTLLKATCSTG